MNVMAYPDTNLEAAMAYAKLGWYVLPLAAGSKLPATKNGWKDASINPQTINNWFSRRPELNVGISLAQSHLVVVDIDTHDGIDGHDAIPLIEREFGCSMDASVVQLTPTGGEHRIFSNPNGLKFPGRFFSDDKRGIDLKYNGYIVAYPSTRSDCSGQRYEWEASGDPLDENSPAMPTAIPPVIAKRLGESQSAASEQTEAFVAVSDSQWAEILSALGRVPSDDRETWLMVGMALHSTGRETARSVWDQWSSKSAKYDPKDQERTWRSFHGKGLNGSTYRTIFNLAYRSGWTAPTAIGNAAPVQRQQLPAKPNLITDASTIYSEVISQKPIIKHWLPADSIGIMYGESGSGKTWAAIDMALCVASGTSWCWQKTHQGKVLYIAAEGGAGVAMRVKGWLLGHPEVSPDAVDKNFKILPSRVDLSAANSDASPLPTAQDVQEWLLEMNFLPSLIVIDTLSQTLTGDENSASDIAAYMNNIGTFLRERFKACVMIVHHSGKNNNTTFRGSSAIKANTSFMLRVTRENEKTLESQIQVEHMKDWMLPDPIKLQWNRVTLGADEDGEEITSVYLLPSGAIDPAYWTKKLIKKTELPESLNDRERLVLKSVRLLVSQRMRPSRDAVRETFYAQAGLDKENKSRRMIYQRALKAALDDQLISEVQDTLVVGSTTEEIDDEYPV